MTRAYATFWSLLFALAGGSGLAYLAVNFSPWQVEGYLNRPLVILMFGAMLVGVTGVAALGALALQQRFPALGGGSRLRAPQPALALRQGLLFACAVVANALLAFFQLFDMIFLFAIPLLAGLLEAYFQQRPARR